MPKTDSTLATAEQARRYATAKAAATYLAVGERTICRMVARGDLPGYRLPGSRGIRVDLNELDAVIHAKDAGPRSAIQPAETELTAYINRVVDAAPPLTAEQRDRLAVLLRGDAA